MLVIAVIVTASAGDTDTAWQAAAVAEAMMIRVMFTELDGEMATHSLLFDARKSTDELKSAMAAALNGQTESGGAAISP